MEKYPFALLMFVCAVACAPESADSGEATSTNSLLFGSETGSCDQPGIYVDVGGSPAIVQVSVQTADGDWYASETFRSPDDSSLWYVGCFGDAGGTWEMSWVRPTD